MKKKIFSILLFGFLIFTFNTHFNTNSVFAEVNETNNEIIQENTEATFNPSTDDVLDKPIFNNDKKQPKKKDIKTKISSYIIKTFGFILLAFVAAICLLFIVIANKQRQAEKRRKKMSANANVISAVDNFAKHRIQD